MIAIKKTADGLTLKQQSHLSLWATIYIKYKKYFTHYTHPHPHIFSPKTNNCKGST